MNNKQRDVLQVHKNFLMKNIIWTTELSRRLFENGLITESVIRAVEVCVFSFMFIFDS